MEMEAILTTVTSIVTAAVGWVGQYVTLVTENPIILAYTLLPFVGLGVGLLSRLFRVN